MESTLISEEEIKLIQEEVAPLLAEAVRKFTELNIDARMICISSIAIALDFIISEYGFSEKAQEEFAWQCKHVWETFARIEDRND